MRAAARGASAAASRRLCRHAAVPRGGVLVARRNYFGAATQHNVPEESVRRPENSSYAHRTIQDWKPSIVKTAHLAGLDEPPDGSDSVFMHFILIDNFGFRWPVRFFLWPGITIWDICNITCQMTFSMYPVTMPSGNMPIALDPRKRTFLLDKCPYGHASEHRCNQCIVAMPYEYLDAMSPPYYGERQWLQQKADTFQFFISANCRLACQIFVEDWMDGMTVVVPQENSLAYNMYIQGGADKESMDAMMGFGIGTGGTGGPMSPGYMQIMPDGPEGPKAKGWMHNLHHYWDDQYFTPDLMDNVKWFMPTKAGQVPLTDIFWHDFVDDIIREHDPNWQGRYRFMRQ